MAASRGALAVQRSGGRVPQLRRRGGARKARAFAVARWCDLATPAGGAWIRAARAFVAVLPGARGTKKIVPSDYCPSDKLAWRIATGFEVE
jgi:hypothetical protein